MASISLKYKSKSGNLTAPGDVDLGAMIPLMTTTVGGTSVASVTFSNIPQVYEHLQIRTMVKTNEATTGATNIEMRFNSDTAGNYTRHYLFTTGSSVGVGGGGGASYLTTGSAAQGGAAIANMFGVSVIDILDYSNANKYKTMRSLSGVDQNTSGSSYMWAAQSGLWMNTSAVTSISLFSASSNISQYSSFALYGIKRAGA
jgi:hypothetical protein